MYVTTFKYKEKKENTHFNMTDIDELSIQQQQKKWCIKTQIKPS